MYEDIEDEKVIALAQFLGLDEDEAQDIEETRWGDYTYGDEEYIVADYDEAYSKAVEREQELCEELGLEGLSESYQGHVIRSFCNWDWESAVEEMDRNYAEDIRDENDSEYGSRLIQEVLDNDEDFDEEGGWRVQIVVGDKTYYLNNDEEFTLDDSDVKKFTRYSEAEDYDDEDKIKEDLGLSEDDEIDYEFEIKWDDSDIDWYAWIDCRVEQMAGNYSGIDDLIDEGLVDEDFLKDYIDWEAVAEDIVDTDGIANALATYDGNENEEEVNGTTYYIYREN